MRQQLLKKQDKAVLVIDLAKRVQFKCVLDEGKKTNRQIGDVIRLITEARRLGVPVFTFMENGRPVMEQIQNAISRYGPVLEKRHPSAFGELRYTNNLLKERLESLGVTKLFIAGYDLSICVGATIQSAVAHGYAIHTAPSLLFISPLVPDVASKELLEYYRKEKMLERTFSRLLDKLRN